MEDSSTKNWLEDRLVWALNVNYELEFEKKEEGEWEHDGVFEWFTGTSYRFIRNWSAGLEFWNHRADHALRRRTLVGQFRFSSSTANWTGFQPRQ